MLCNIPAKEIEFYQRDVEKALDNLTFENMTYESDNIEFKITNTLQVPVFKIKGIEQELANEIHYVVNSMIEAIIGNIHEFDYASGGRIRMIEALNITLLDYIQYAKNKHKKDRLPEEWSKSY